MWIPGPGSDREPRQGPHNSGSAVKLLQKLWEIITVHVNAARQRILQKRLFRSGAAL